ncbi:hypothetical protein [Nocardioides sp.]
MAGQMFEIKIQAIGEVRDADGNLLETVPVESTITCTAEEARALLGEDPS